MSKENTTVGEKAVSFLLENGYGPKEEFKGCTEEEIQELEREWNVTLPAAYKSCMREIGKYAGGFQRGGEFFYPSVKKQKEHAQKRVEENSVNFEFDDSTVVFLGLQGYSFWFFDCQNGDDPPVYHYMEGEDEATKKADSFSEWLVQEIQR